MTLPNSRQRFSQTLHRGGPPNKTSHSTPDARKLRLGTVNVGTLRGRANEVAETLERREIDVCCIQEAGWRGEGARHIDGRSKQFKLFWTGNSSGHGGVGIMVAEKWIEKVIAVNRVNDRLMSVKLLVGKTIMAIHSTYAPQQGLPKECLHKISS